MHTARRRLPATTLTLPLLPALARTVAEIGHTDFETSQWCGIVAQAGTPRDIVKRAGVKSD